MSTSLFDLASKWPISHPDAPKDDELPPPQSSEQQQQSNNGILGYVNGPLARPSTQLQTMRIIDHQSDPILSFLYTPGSSIPINLEQFVGNMIEIRIPAKHLTLKNKEVMNHHLWGGNFHLFDQQLQDVLPAVPPSLVLLTNPTAALDTNEDWSNESQALKIPTRCCGCHKQSEQQTEISPTSLELYQQYFSSTLSSPDSPTTTSPTFKPIPYPLYYIDPSPTAYLLHTSPTRAIRYHPGDHYYTEDSDVVAMLHHSGVLNLTLTQPTYAFLSVILRILPTLPFYPGTALKSTLYNSRSMYSNQYNGVTLQIVRTERAVGDRDTYPSRNQFLPHLPAIVYYDKRDEDGIFYNTTLSHPNHKNSINALKSSKIMQDYFNKGHNACALSQQSGIPNDDEPAWFYDVKLNTTIKRSIIRSTDCIVPSCFDWEPFLSGEKFKEIFPSIFIDELKGEQKEQKNQQQNGQEDGENSTTMGDDVQDNNNNNSKEMNSLQESNQFNQQQQQQQEEELKDQEMGELNQQEILVQGSSSSQSSHSPSSPRQERSAFDIVSIIPTQLVPVRMTGGDKQISKVSLSRGTTDDTFAYSGVQTDNFYFSYRHGHALLNRWTSSPSLPVPTQPTSLPVNTPFQMAGSRFGVMMDPLYQLPTSLQLLSYNIELTTTCCLYIIRCHGFNRMINRQPYTSSYPSLLPPQDMDDIHQLPDTLTNTTTTPTHFDLGDDNDDNKKKRAKPNQKGINDDDMVSLDGSTADPVPNTKTNPLNNLIKPSPIDPFYYEPIFSVATIAPKPDVPYMFTHTQFTQLRHIYSVVRSFLDRNGDIEVEHPPLVMAGPVLESIVTPLSEKKRPRKSMSNDSNDDINNNSSTGSNNLSASQLDQSTLITSPPQQSSLDQTPLIDITPLLSLLGQDTALDCPVLITPFGDKTLGLVLQKVKDREIIGLTRFPALDFKTSASLTAYACLYLSQHKPDRYGEIKKCYKKYSYYQKQKMIPIDAIFYVLEFFTYHKETKIIAKDLVWDDLIWTEDSLVIRAKTTFGPQSGPTLLSTGPVMGVRFQLK